MVGLGSACLATTIDTEETPEFAAWKAGLEEAEKRWQQGDHVHSAL